MLTLTFIQLTLSIYLACSNFKQEKSSIKRYAFILFGILCLLISIIQLQSLYLTGDYIPAIALENIGELSNIGFGVYFILLPILLYFFIVGYFSKRVRKAFSFPITIILIASSFFPLSPNYAFYRTSLTYYQERNSQDLPMTEITQVHNELFKPTVFEFNDNKIIPEQKGKNVIVIFTEGMSYDIISSKVTPNLAQFEKQSVSFINYYNHTAATFRGLRGQLTSSYQLSGGFTLKKDGIGQSSKQQILDKFNSTTRTTPITHALKPHGYATYFQSSNGTQEPLSIMLSTLGFDQIFGFENMPSKNALNIKELSDKESYDLLFKNLNEIKQPFFYGMYSVGTHVGLDSPDVKYGDGKNVYLNKFYSVDHWFGEFLKKFNESGLAENTILIFTADHATYPAEDFRKTFNTKSKEFADRIPLMIYYKGIKPLKVNVKGVNSLSLSPTVLQILGIREFKNLFLGSSLIDSASPKIYNCVTAIGGTYLFTCAGEMKAIANPNFEKKIRRLQIFGDK